jgi:membrane protease YdiL (CAAX protease family)
MEANLDGDGVAKPERSFPPSNWGPWAAVLGVLAALAVGIFLSVPALFVGAQEGKVEALFPPSFESGVSFDKGDSTALAVDDRNRLLFADHEDEVRAFAAGGEEIEVSAQPGLEDSQGLAFDDARGILAVSEKGPGRITLHIPARGGAGEHLAKIEAADLPLGLAGFEPEAMAFGGAGQLYVVDAGDDAVLRFSAAGKYLGRLDGSATPAGSFDFGSNDNGVAVDSHEGPGRGDVYVLSGKDDGTVWAFDRRGRFNWEATPESGDEFAAVATDAFGNLWIAEPGGDAYSYAAPGPKGPAERVDDVPGARSGKIDTGDEVRALAFAGEGHLFVARDLDDTLDTLGNVLSQIGTALGFLLVPMALAAMRGAKGPREIFSRLGLRAFKPSALKWMGLTVVLYLAFNFFYSTVITEPHQQDIAKGFGAIPIQIILIVFAAPVTEEICFRGMLFGGLREKLPRIVAALICGLIFGALHALTGVTAVPPLIVFGFLLALLYERTGSIIPGMLLHMLNNIVALASQ